MQTHHALSLALLGSVLTFVGGVSKSRSGLPTKTMPGSYPSTGGIV
jgi:hypothetical protein